MILLQEMFPSFVVFFSTPLNEINPHEMWVVRIDGD